MKTILFLCTGNTCRSPMAECLFNDISAKKKLPFRAVSAGVYAQEGEAASDGACAAMQARGLSLRDHQAQPITGGLVDTVALIVAMTPNHAALCKERFPDLSVPLISFSPAIPDPFGGSVKVYGETAGAMAPQITALVWALETGEAPLANR